MCHDPTAITGQFALAGRKLVVLRLARLCCLFARAAGIGGYRGHRGDRHLMARLDLWEYSRHPAEPADRRAVARLFYEWRVRCLSKILPAPRGNHPAKIHPCRFRVGDLRPGHRSGREPNARPCGWTDRTAVLRMGGTNLHSWPDAGFERTQPRRDVALWNRRRAEPAPGDGDERRSMGGGLGHFRHEPPEDPATELAKLPAIQGFPWHIASCPNQRA